MEDVLFTAAETLERSPVGVVCNPRLSMTDCRISSDFTRSGYRLTGELPFAYCCWLVFESPVDAEELYWTNISVLAVYTGVAVNVNPATTPVATQNSTVSAIQCFLIALSTSEIVMFPLIFHTGAGALPHSPRNAQSFTGYLTVYPDKDSLPHISKEPHFVIPNRGSR